MNNNQVATTDLRVKYSGFLQSNNNGSTLYILQPEKKDDSGIVTENKDNIEYVYLNSANFDKFQLSSDDKFLLTEKKSGNNSENEFNKKFTIYKTNGMYMYPNEIQGVKAIWAN